MYKKRPLFVTLEGIEGSGKSYQCIKLYKNLKKRNIPVIFTREPGGTIGAEKIRKIILQDYFHPDFKEQFNKYTDTLLYLAARNEHIENKIKPAILKKKIIICDRFIDSTLAYQGGGRQIDIEWLIRLNQFATYDIAPNVTFYIDVLPEEALKRKNQEKDRIEMAGIELQSRVRNAYLEIAKRFQSRYLIIDGHDSIDNIHDIIISHIKQRKYL